MVAFVLAFNRVSDPGLQLFPFGLSARRVRLEVGGKKMEGARRPVAKGPGRLFSLRGARFIWIFFQSSHAWHAANDTCTCRPS